MHPKLISTPESSNIAGYRYLPNKQALVVAYKNGTAYLFKDVPQDVADDLGRAESKGAFVNQVIKSGHFPYIKLVEPDLDDVLRDASALQDASSAKPKSRKHNMADLLLRYPFLQQLL